MIKVVNPQHVPVEPHGCYLDYTYCASPACQNKCGRKMSVAIKAQFKKMKDARVAFNNFCDGEK
jgi:hypothetical protein